MHSTTAGHASKPVPNSSETRPLGTCDKHPRLQHKQTIWQLFVCWLPSCSRAYWGSGDSSVVRAPDSWLKGRWFESPQERRESFLVFFLQGQLSVPTLISVTVPPSCYCSSTLKILVILPKVQVAARLQLNTRPPYVCGFAWSDMVHGCMVYTELASRRQQFPVAPDMSAL